MARIAVVTDSSACLPADLAHRPDVLVVPITIHLASRDLRDGMASAPKRVYEALLRNEPVKSTAPTPLEYLAAIEEADADAVVVITPAAEFTVMHRNASLAGDLAERPAVIVDSRTAAAAQGLVVRDAIEAAETGSLDDVVRVVEEAARRVHLVASLETLEFVRRSGRIPPFALDLARHLGIRPVFHLRDGAIERLGLPRNRDAALRRIRLEWAARGGPDASRTWVFHAECDDGAGELARMIADVELTTEFSPSMGIHTGPGVVGAAWLSRA